MSLVEAGLGDNDEHLLHLESDFFSLWQRIQGTTLISVCMVMRTQYVRSKLYKQSEFMLVYCEPYGTGLPLSSQCDGAVLEVAICCSLLQLRLCLALRDSSPSRSDRAHLHLKQLMHRCMYNSVFCASWPS